MAYFPKVIEADGKKIEINPLDPGEMLDFFEAFTSRQVGSQAWFRYALWICSVRSINSVPVLFPKDGNDIKSLARTLGHPGVLAVQKCIDGEPGEMAVDQVDLETAKN